MVIILWVVVSVCGSFTHKSFKLTGLVMQNKTKKIELVNHKKVRLNTFTVLKIIMLESLNCNSILLCENFSVIQKRG